MPVLQQFSRILFCVQVVCLTCGTICCSRILLYTFPHYFRLYVVLLRTRFAKCSTECVALFTEHFQFIGCRLLTNKIKYAALGRIQNTINVLPQTVRVPTPSDACVYGQISPKPCTMFSLCLPPLSWRKSARNFVLGGVLSCARYHTPLRKVSHPHGRRSTLERILLLAGRLHTLSDAASMGRPPESHAPFSLCVPPSFGRKSAWKFVSGDMCYISWYVVYGMSRRVCCCYRQG